MLPESSQITISDLESRLAELEPVFIEVGGVFNFSHPSFQEILTAKQFADEINSGDISIEDCYTYIWSHNIALFDSEISTVNQSWNKIIHSISLMLWESKFYELLEVITKNYFLWKTNLKLEDSKHSGIFEDLALASNLIGNRKNVDYSSPIIDNIVKELCDYMRCYDDRNNQIINFASKYRASLGKMNSLNVAFDAFDFVMWCARVPDLEYPIDDARYSAEGEAAEIITQISKQSEQNRRAIENELLSRFNQSHEIPEQIKLMKLMGAIGTKKSLEALCQFMHTSRSGDIVTDHYRAESYWFSIFRIIERHDFDPQLINLFNQHMYRKLWDSHVMITYHQHITEYAHRFQNWGKRESLYSYLEKKGMQFWDYWVTYTHK